MSKPTRKEYWDTLDNDFRHIVAKTLEKANIIAYADKMVEKALQSQATAHQKEMEALVGEILKEKRSIGFCDEEFVTTDDIEEIAQKHNINIK